VNKLGINNRNEKICYCNNVTREDIYNAIQNGADSVNSVIKMTGAMLNSNCAVNNPKKTCCYNDIVRVFNELKRDV
jgi:bacterioferritin-associated ferredoxin